MSDISHYLEDFGLCYGIDELEQVRKAFLADMEKGLNRLYEGLPMLPSYFPILSFPEEDSDVIVVDIGGSRLRVFLLRLKKNGQTENLYSHEEPVPGRNHSITADEFFQIIAETILPVAESSNRIGICFSFSSRMRPDHDSVVEGLEKELVVDGIEGAVIGERICRALSTAGVRTKHNVVVLNDTTAALLGAAAGCNKRAYSAWLGIVLGTGFNCCYLERNCTILKDRNLRNRSGSSIINIEAGEFSHVNQTRADRMMSKLTNEPKRAIVEKMIAGGYQGKLLECLVRCALEDGFFSRGFSERFRDKQHDVTASDLSVFLKTGGKEGFLYELSLCDGAVTKDTHMLFTLAERLIDRAAALTAAIVTAVLCHVQSGMDPLHPAFIAIEGSAYGKNQIFQSKIHEYLLEYTEKNHGFYTRVFLGRNVNRIGSAIASFVKQP